MVLAGATDSQAMNSNTAAPCLRQDLLCSEHLTVSQNHDIAALARKHLYSTGNALRKLCSSPSSNCMQKVPRCIACRFFGQG
jgi:hypothetical protein